jgi:hypothetical protein
MSLTLYHYTTQQGHDAIIKSMKLLPSTTEGKAHTHYGKGIYFGDLDPIFDARYLGVEEVAGNLFNTVSKSNIEKFFYYVEVRFPDGFAPAPESVVDDDGYKNKYLYLLKTENPLLMSLDAPNPGVVQLIDHGLTYWGQIREMSVAQDNSYQNMDIKNEMPGWKQKNQVGSQLSCAEKKDIFRQSPAWDPGQ